MVKAQRQTPVHTSITCHVARPITELHLALHYAYIDKMTNRQAPS